MRNDGELQGISGNEREGSGTPFATIENEAFCLTIHVSDINVSLN